ncbi:hypothetical protein NF212_08650 [Parasalinivibrio latis]|uniref:hypothetical protein n=1 Tax=Parasalinivibrio latis TaxID=2952610 RepID=UPI0030E366B7
MGTYTLRCSCDQDFDIERLKDIYEEKTASQALMRAAANVPELLAEIEHLKAELQLVKGQNETWREATEGLFSNLKTLQNLKNGKV